jgi:hypothetical protein
MIRRVTGRWSREFVDGEGTLVARVWEDDLSIGSTAPRLTEDGVFDTQRAHARPLAEITSVQRPAEARTRASSNRCLTDRSCSLVQEGPFVVEMAGGQDPRSIGWGARHAEVAGRGPVPRVGSVESSSPSEVQASR